MSKKQIKIGPFSIRPHIRNGEATGAWQIDVPAEFNPTGRRKRRNFKSKIEAQKIARSLLREQRLKGKAGPLGSPKIGVTFSELSKLWLIAQKDRVAIRRKRKASLTTDAYQMRNLLKFMANMDTAAITEEVTLSYQKARIEEGLKPATINSETRLLTQIFRWGIDRRLCLAVPKIESIPETRRRLEVLTIPEVEKLLECFTHNTPRFLVRLIAETGVRSSEIFNLLWHDVDRESCTIFVLPEDDFNTKNDNSQRLIKISKSMVDDLMQLPRSSHLVFPGKQGKVRDNIKKSTQYSLPTGRFSARRQAT